ncbi:hypothetical protein [Plantactinospora sp. WMMB782]|uniref:hypothetical protein n=1 Tax=Plantactinospora sp. WMMB782 TaxID=3404121 RepID=UPI003B94D593
MTLPRWLLRAGWTGWRSELGWLLTPLGVVLLLAVLGELVGSAMPIPGATQQMSADHYAGLVEAVVHAVYGVPVGVIVLVTGLWLVWGGRRGPAGQVPAADGAAEPPR